MAFKQSQSAIVIDTLIADLVHEAIDQRQSRIKEPIEAGPCQRLYDILGIMPYSPNDEEIIIDNESPVKGWINENRASNPICSAPGLSQSQRDLQIDYPMMERKQQWHNWLVPALADDSSGDELEIYRRNDQLIKKFSDIACQTEQLRFRKLYPQVATPVDSAPLERAPCELNRQTIYIDAVSVATPSLQNRPPLADRFCYMLTDFASALYCSLAIMCCCTPSMFR
ncbi:hypothetical protein ACLKA7_002212 [Drosophila subpalustris]